MNRKFFLKNTAGLLGISSVLMEACTKDEAMQPVSSTATDEATAACTTTPEETGGPFEEDLSMNSTIHRTDIREDRTGILLNLALTIVNTNNNCAPVQNARVDIWHCDKDGYYSGFVNTGYLGTIDNTGKTFLRGIQNTDANGIVNFQTVYPGWYPGRVTHIHLEVFVNDISKKTTQIAFPDPVNRKVYTGSPLYTPHGVNTTVKKNIDDSVFKNSLADELATIISASPAAINSSFTIGVAL